MKTSKKIIKEELKKFCITNDLLLCNTNEIICYKNEHFLFYIVCDFKPTYCDIGIYFTPLFISQEELTLTFGNTLIHLTGQTDLEITYSLKETTIINKLNKNFKIALNKLKKWSDIITPSFIVQNIGSKKYNDLFYTEDLWKLELLGYCYGIQGYTLEATSAFLKLIADFSSRELEEWEMFKLDEWENALKTIETNKFDEFIEHKIQEAEKKLLI